MSKRKRLTRAEDLQQFLDSKAFKDGLRAFFEKCYSEPAPVLGPGMTRLRKNDPMARG